MFSKAARSSWAEPVCSISLPSNRAPFFQKWAQKPGLEPPFIQEDKVIPRIQVWKYWEQIFWVLLDPPWAAPLSPLPNVRHSPQALLISPGILCPHPGRGKKIPFCFTRPGTKAELCKHHWGKDFAAGNLMGTGRKGKSNGAVPLPGGWSCAAPEAGKQNLQDVTKSHLHTLNFPLTPAFTTAKNSCSKSPNLGFL